MSPSLRVWDVQDVVKCHDAYLHKVLYGALIELKAYKSLISMDNPRLEKYLKAEGGLPEQGVDKAIGPLSPAQVACKFKNPVQSNSVDCLAPICISLPIGVT